MAGRVGVPTAFERVVTQDAAVKTTAKKAARQARSVVVTPSGIVVLQGGIALAVALLLASLDPAQAFAAGLAGFVCVGANGWFAWQLGRNRDPRRLLWMGVLRSVLTMALLGVVIVGFKPARAGFLGTFALSQAAYFWQGRARD